MRGRRKEVLAAGMPSPLGHYVDAVRYGELLYISGCAPVDTDGRLVGGADVCEQARQVMRNIGLILDAAGGTYGDLLTMTIYAMDVADAALINTARREFLGATRTASTLVGCASLAVPGMRVEMNAVAAVSRFPWRRQGQRWLAT